MQYKNLGPCITGPENEQDDLYVVLATSGVVTSTTVIYFGGSGGAAMSNTREVIERAIKMLGQWPAMHDDPSGRSWRKAQMSRGALQALLDTGLESELAEARIEVGRHVDKYWAGQITRAENLGAEQMRERCSSREVAIDIACEAHRIYGQRDARDTWGRIRSVYLDTAYDGYDGDLAEFIEYKISNLPLRGKDD